MDDFSVKGDEVRQGQHVYLDALSKACIATFDDVDLSETMLRQLNDGNTPLTLMTAGKVARTFKDGGGLPFSVRLRADHTYIGVCRLADIGWQARHAQLQVGILDETRLSVVMLADVLQTVLQFAYWEANLNRIAVRCVEDQTMMRQALHRAGFTEEGHLRQEVYRDGHYLDVIVYSMLRRNWSG